MYVGLFMIFIVGSWNLFTYVGDKTLAYFIQLHQSGYSCDETETERERVDRDSG